MKSAGLRFRIWLAHWLLIATCICLIIQGVYIWLNGEIIMVEPIRWLLASELLLLLTLLTLSMWNIISIARLRDDSDN